MGPAVCAAHRRKKRAENPPLGGAGGAAGQVKAVAAQGKHAADLFFRPAHRLFLLVLLTEEHHRSAEVLQHQRQRHAVEGNVAGQGLEHDALKVLVLCHQSGQALELLRVQRNAGHIQTLDGILHRPSPFPCSFGAAEPPCPVAGAVRSARFTLSLL